MCLSVTSHQGPFTAVPRSWHACSPAGESGHPRGSALKGGHQGTGGLHPALAAGDTGTSLGEQRLDRAQPGARVFLQVITGALQCLLWVLRFPLPSVDAQAGQLTKHLFLLLKDYARLGAARGPNFHLAVNCFKVRGRWAPWLVLLWRARPPWHQVPRLSALSHPTVCDRPLEEGQVPPGH